MQGRGTLSPFLTTATFPLQSRHIYRPACFACNTNCIATTVIYMYAPTDIVSIVNKSGVHYKGLNCLSACSKSCHEWYWQSQAWVAITIITIETVKPCCKLAALALPVMLWLLWLPLLFSGDVHAFTRCMQVYGSAELSRAFWSETFVSRQDIV